jgi:hypothetical protein
MAWNVEICRDTYSKPERAEKSRDLINNGFEYWARFKTEKEARQWAETSERLTGVKLHVYQTYGSNITL